jgi:hypothetical protein
MLWESAVAAATYTALGNPSETGTLQRLQRHAKGIRVRGPKGLPVECLGYVGRSHARHIAASNTARSDREPNLWIAILRRMCSNCLPQGATVASYCTLAAHPLAIRADR